MYLLRPLRQSLASLLIASLSICSSACMVTKVHKREIAQVPQPQLEHIVGVTTKSGTDVRFSPPGGKATADAIDAMIGNNPYHVALQDVQRIWVEERGVSAPRTIGLAVGIAAASLVTLAAIAVATKQSCPFVYSWDGAQYNFDAEPYGGAITRGLERDDYSELEHLRAQNGKYRLLLTNEVDETQYTNLMELWVVDHARGSRVISDENGMLHSFPHVEELRAARDKSGADLLPWLRSTDRLIWEPDAVAAADGDLHQEVILTFPKAAGATQANLIVNAATGLWGSYMIKKMVELHGRESAQWLASLNGNPAAVEGIHAWGAREETYRLKVEVEEPTGWEARGAIPSGGPFLAEDRSIPLDVSRVRGTEVRIRLRPPVGFWALNSFGIAYGAPGPAPITRVPVRSARTTDGVDVRPALAATDDQYYPMPLMTDRAEVIFDAPAAKKNSDRTVFLHSRGWYELHLRDNREPDNATFTRIMTVPGAAVEFAANRFTEWQRPAKR